MKISYNLEEFLDNPGEYNCLYLVNKNLGDEEAIRIAKILEQSETLEDISLRENQITDISAKVIFNAALKNKVLRRLDLDNNKIEGKDIFTEECVNNSLQEINIDNNFLGNEGAWNIVKMLEQCENIKSLSLSSNQITDEMAIKIAELTLPRLEIFCFSSNIITDDTAADIFNLALQSKSLEEIVLNNNKITGKSEKWSSFLSSESINHSLENIFLSRNQIDDEGAKNIFQLLSHAENINKIVIYSNQITGKEAHENFKSLYNLKNLDYLCLESNIIDNAGVKEILEVIQAIGSMKNLYLDKNMIGNEGAALILKTAEKTDNHLKHVFCRGNPIESLEYKHVHFTNGFTDMKVIFDQYDNGEYDWVRFDQETMLSGENINQQDGLNEFVFSFYDS